MPFIMDDPIEENAAPAPTEPVAERPINLMSYVYNGPSGFADMKHVNNFGRYLFSLTGKHPKNDRTKNNYGVSFDQGRVSEGGFVTSPSADFDAFKASHLKGFTRAAQLVNDLIYVMFVIEVDGILTSNVLMHVGDELQTSMDEETINTFADAVFGGQKGFNEFLEQLHEIGTKVIAYEDVTQEVREKVERRLHQQFRNDEPADVVFSISHTDQDSMYHLHRILRS